MNKEYRIFIPCACKEHLLELFWDGDEKIKMADLAFWQAGHRNVDSLFQRIKWAWRCLVKKEIYTDMICVDERVKDELIRALQNLNFKG